LPKIQLELIEDVSPELPNGFLKLIRRRYRARYPDGSSSKPFLYDQIDRAALDAVVICAHYPTSEGRFVYLRSALRPPLADRDPRREPFTAKGSAGGLWELPAGMIEVRDQCAGGPQLTAQRELYEEVGFQIPLATLKPLGPVTFPAPGFVAEQHFYFEVEVAPAERREPALDGSALEQFGQVTALSIEHALEMCRRGEIQDAKTELGLRRLNERYP